MGVMATMPEQLRLSFLSDSALGLSMALTLLGCSSTQAPVHIKTSSPSQAQSEAPPPASPKTPAEPPLPSTKACKIAHAQDFDFWIGRWEVRSADGTVVGYNHIHPILDGCTLQEDYRTKNGAYVGRSLNRYDPATQAWHQVWVDNGGLWLSLQGGLQEGAMVLRGPYLQRRDNKGQVLASPRPTVQEIRWSQLPDHRVQQTWRSSSDEGKTWTTLFDGFYTRIEVIPAPPN